MTTPSGHDQSQQAGAGSEGRPLTPNPSPLILEGDATEMGGGAGGGGDGRIPQTGWYHLRFNYTDKQKNNAVGYACKYGGNAATAFGNYISITDSLSRAGKFKYNNTKDKWWDVIGIHDGGKLCWSGNGWLYSETTYEVGWQLRNGVLWGQWRGPSYSVGFTWYDDRLTDGWFLGTGLPLLTNCEWIPAT